MGIDVSVIEHLEEEYYASVQSRPTERDVERKLDEGKLFPWDHEVVSQWPKTEHLRFCVGGATDVRGRSLYPKGHKVDAKEFAHVKYSHDGLAFACNRCRRELRRRSWRDAYAFEGLRKVG